MITFFYLRIKKSMATVRYFFRKAINNKVSVYVIYRHGDKNKMFSTGIKINPEQWNPKKEKIIRLHIIEQIQQKIPRIA